jgi:DNA polymerase III delta subunit
MAQSLEAGATREQVYAEHRVWQQRQKATGAALGRLRASQFAALLTDAFSIDQQLKGMRRGNPWEALEALLFRLAGVNLRLAAGSSSQ